MILKITTPENFDRLIDYLERHRALVWPSVDLVGCTYRDSFIADVKTMLKHDTVFVDVKWDYDPRRDAVVGNMTYIPASAMASDVDYLNEVNALNEQLQTEQVR